MTDRTTWVPEDVDITIPSVARMYDYALGGGHNFAVDREMFDKLITVVPHLGQGMRSNRAFLRRAVLALVEAGVRQFLDIGSGIPTAGNVHEIAQRAAPESHVVYVDIDPVAIAHSELLLQDNDQATAILADLRDPTNILEHPKTQQMLDFDAPIGLLMTAIFHYVADSDGPLDLLARYRDALAPGSYLVLSHATAEHLPPQEAAAAVELFKKTKVPAACTRTHAEITKLFSGFELLNPGLVTLDRWQPYPTNDGGKPGEDYMYAGIGIKR